MNREELVRVGKVVLLACLMVSLAGSVCNAQGREGRWELGFTGNFLGGASTTIEDVTISEDDWFLYGVQLGWNATDHLNVNTEFMFASVDAGGSFEEDGETVVVTADQDTFVWMVNLEYNILAEPLTPFIMGGVGLGYSQADASGFVDGVLVGSASESSTGFAYNVGAGGRWDISDNIFAKVYYRIIWDDSGDSRDGVAFCLGWMF